jgi:hypothetical protein
MPAALERLFANAQSQPRSVAFKVALSAWLLALPSLVLGLFPIDDPDQRRVILEHLHGVASPRRWYDLYQIIPADPMRAVVERFAGVRPWWSFPGLRIGFFRPVAVLTQYFDYALYPRQLWSMHLHSALWYFLAVWLVALMCIRLSADARIGLIGALLYAWDDAHLQPIAWLAHRNALIGTVFAVGGLLLHHARARGARSSASWPSGACFLVAFLAAENSVAILGFVGAYALCLDDRAWSKRLLALIPSVLATWVWFAWRHSLGYGAYGSGFYLDPFGDAASYLAALPERYLELLRGQFGAPWARTDLFAVSWLKALDGLGKWLILPALGVYVARNCDRNRELAFWALAGVTALLPLTAAPPNERLLTIAGIAWWMLTAHLLWALAFVSRGNLRSRDSLSVLAKFGLPALAARVGAIVLLLAIAVPHFIIAPFALAIGCSRFAAESAPDSHAAVLGNSPSLAATDVVIVNSRDAIQAALIPASRLARGLRAPRHNHVLGAAIDEVEVTRTDQRTFELYSPPGYLLDLFARFWRGSSATMSQGERVFVTGYTAHVLRVTPDGRPLRVRFTFDRPLEDASLRFLYWNGSRFDDFHFSPLGQRRIIRADFDHTQQLPEQAITN